MKCSCLALLVVTCPAALFGQSQRQPLPPHPNEPATEEIQTERILSPRQSSAVSSAQGSTTPLLEPAQVKALMHKVWLAEFRLNDLLDQVHPEKWKISPGERQSFAQSLDSLRKSMADQENWRGQFEGRPDSLYLGFQTYMAIGSVLPRLDGVAQAVSRYENSSFGAQYSQSGNQLFDLRQQIVSHLTYLLKNQDGLMLATQMNLASCQNELNYAERNKHGPAIPMKNILPEFKGRKRTSQAESREGAKKGSVKAAPVSKRAQ